MRVSLLVLLVLEESRHGPTPPPVTLTPADQPGVDALVRRHTTPSRPPPAL